MKRWICQIIGVFYLLSFCYGHNFESGEKHIVVEEIVAKLYDVVKQSFHNVEQKNRNKYVKSFEDKVKAIAKSMGIDDPSYSQIITRGIKVILKESQKEGHKNAKNYRKSNLSAKPGKEFNNLTLIKNHLDGDLKGEMIMDITDKIGKLSIYYKDKPRSEKFKILKQINDKIASLSDVEHSRRKFESKFSKLNKQGFNVKKEEHKSFETNDLEVNKIRHVFKPLYAMGVNETTTTTTESTVPVTGAYSCVTASRSMCSRLDYTFKIICPHDHKAIDLNKMCNGQKDCISGYDELNCIELVANKIKDASQLMADIESYLLQQCLKNKNDANLMIKQNTLLSQILQDQLNVLLSSRSDNRLLDYLASKTVNEMSIVLKTLAMAIRTSICGYNQIEDDKMFSLSLKKSALTVKEHEVADFEDTLLVSHEFPADLCRCENGFCTESNCHIICRRECWQRYSLMRWGCLSTTGGTSVPLDVICDGKIDCVEKTDELECSSSDNKEIKFKATELYEKVLETIFKMAMMKEHSVVLKDLQNLLNAVKQLQKVTVQDKPDLNGIRNTRDICFSMLVAIYEKITFKGDVRNLEDTHFMLLSMNKNLVLAMKYSHTGNRIIRPEYGCYCVANQCVMLECSRKCNQTCTMQGNFTRYSCKNNKNITVPFGAICDLKGDCPLKDDEDHCQKDVCRNHQLLLLSDAIRDVGDRYKDTTLGLALDSWKSKATSKLTSVKSNMRPTSTLLRDLINEILLDLLFAYGDVVETRHNKDQIQLEYGVKQRFVEIIKSCGN